MRRVFITGIHEGNATLAAGRELVGKYGLRQFAAAQRIEDADIVLYLDHGYVGLAELPCLLGRVRRRVPSAMHFIFSESDWPFPVLPGAYPSLSGCYPWAFSWCYLPRLNFA